MWGRVFELMARGASEGRGSPIDGEGNRLSTSLWDRWAHGRGGGRWLLVRERRGGRCRKGQGGCVGGDGGGNAASSSAPRVSPPPSPHHPPTTPQEAFTERNAAHILKSLVLFLAHMHSRGIAHMDVKPEVEAGEGGS